MRATRSELEEFAGELAGVEEAIVRRRWIAGEATLSEIEAELGVGLLTLDRMEQRLFSRLKADLGRVPHPVYDIEITKEAIDEEAERVRTGQATHSDVARRWRVCTRRARELLAPVTQMMFGRIVHGARSFIEGRCTCQICRDDLAESVAYYQGGGDARVDLEDLDLAPCQESPRVFYSAGHHEEAKIRSVCRRIGLDVDRVRLAYWKKQRARLWWVDEDGADVRPVTVAAKLYPAVAERTPGPEVWVRRWLRGSVEDEVFAAAMMPGRPVQVVDVGWCDAEGFPSPTRRATHFGVEWSTLCAP